MTPTIEDRLRAHFEDGSARLRLPGPGTDEALRRAQESGGSPGRDPVARPRPWRLALAVAATAAAVAAAVALVPRDHDGSSTVIGRPPGGDPVPSTVPPPATVPPAGAPATGPIVSGGSVLGWWDGSGWVRVDGRPVPAVGGEEYQLVRLDEPIVRTTGSAPRWACRFPDDGVAIDVGDDAAYEPTEPRRVGVAGVPDPRPRPVEMLEPIDVSSSSLQIALIELGIEDAQPYVAQALRADLDGDGSPETLLVAQRQPHGGSRPEEGHYSVVLVQRPDASGVRTDVVVASIAVEAEDTVTSPDDFRVAAVADLNADGRMEVVLDDAFAEARATSVYEVQADGRLDEVLSAGCAP
jgi:hypothetical protein